MSTPHILTSFQGDLVSPSDPEYAKSILRWAANSQRKAALIAFVKNENDVALALKHAKDSSLPIAVHCGGHSASGASSVEGGVVIDLSKYLNTTRIDPDKRLAYVGGGAVWRTVDEAAIAHGLATVGGIVNHTGVGGLTLGGGFGYLTGEHGLTIDNLVQATIVLADGTTVVASEDENVELFWAIRGAGSNFGVCTEFVYKLHPQPATVYSGLLVYPVNVLDDVCAVANEWWEKGPSGKERLFVNTSWDSASASPVIEVVPFFNGSEADGREIFKRFLDLKPIKDATGNVPYEQMNAMTNPIFPHGQCHHMRGYRASRANPESIRRLIALLESLNKEEPDFSAVIIHEYTPFGKVLSVPKDAMPFPRQQINNGFIIATWKDDDRAKNEWAREAVRKIQDVFRADEQAASGANTKVGSISSYDQPDSEEQDFRQSATSRTEDLFGDNYPRLQSLKKKYDPDNVFNKWLVIKPT